MHVENILWPDGLVCPYCGVVDCAYRLEVVRTKPYKKNTEGKERHGLWKCRECRRGANLKKAIFKCGLKGVYQQRGEQNLHRDAAGFDFRYNNREANGLNDAERTFEAISRAVGKRFLYQGSLGA